MPTAAYVLLPLALLLTTAGHAQTVLPQTVAEQTREMSTRLRLNEGQYVRLLSLNRTRLTRQREIERATPTDTAARTSQLAELQDQYELECGRIMSPTQLSQLQQAENPGSTAVGNG